MKRCNICKQSFPATTKYFYKMRENTDGLFGNCITCVRDRQKKYEAYKRANGHQVVEKKTELIKEKIIEEKLVKKETIYTKSSYEPVNEGLKINQLKVQLGQVYKIATPKKKGEPRGFFIGTLIQETRVHITLRNKVGRCETFLKADLLLKEYEIKEAI